MRSSILAVLVCVVSSLLLEPSPGAAEEGVTLTSHLVVDSPELSRTGIRGGDTAEYQFRVRNSGGADLAITGVSPICDCTTVEFDRAIAAGKTGIISAHVHTKPLQTHLRISFLVETNDPKAPTYELRTNTDIIPAYTITPSSSQSIRAPSGKDGTATFDVQFNRVEDVRWDKHVARIGPALVHIVPVPRQRNRFTIAVTVSHRGIGHDVTGEVDLTPLPASIPPLRLVVRRLEAASIVTAPDQDDFGMAGKGDIVTRGFIVFSREQSFHISRVESGDPAIDVKCIVLPAQVGLYKVILTLTMPPAVGHHVGRVTLHTDGRGQETIDVPFQYDVGIRGGFSRIDQAGPGSTPAPNAAGTTPGADVPTGVSPAAR